MRKLVRLVIMLVGIRPAIVTQLGVVNENGESLPEGTILWVYGGDEIPREMRDHVMYISRVRWLGECMKYALILTGVLVALNNFQP